MKSYDNSLPGFTAEASLLTYNPSEYSHKYKRVEDSSIMLAFDECPPCDDCRRLDPPTSWQKEYNKLCWRWDGYQCREFLQPCIPICERYRYCCPNGLESPDCCVQYEACTYSVLSY